MHTVDWLLILSFPICWGIGAWLFWKWDLGGYRSERESRRTMLALDASPTSAADSESNNGSRQ